MDDSSFLVPDWPLPDNVRALTTTRLGGVSIDPFDSFNLGLHVGDDIERVSRNRRMLADHCGLAEGQLQWLNQVHGTLVCEAQTDCVVRKADASYAQEKGVACVIMTADCLPVLFCDTKGRQVAAAHAGWRGLAGGVLEATLASFSEGDSVTAWLGPAIGPNAFEVGQEVVDLFCQHDESCIEYFSPVDAHAAHSDGNKWLADLYSLSRTRLLSAGVSEVYGGEYCTWTDTDRFFSYRREGQTGRMASVIWMA